MDILWPVVVALVISLVAGLRIGYTAPERRAHILAARGLGAPEWRVFWRVGLPLSVRPILIVTGLVLLGMAAGFAAAVLAFRGMKP